MRLLIACPLFPYPSHDVRGANILIFEMVAALARQPDVQVGLLVVRRGSEVSLNGQPRHEIDKGMALLRELGVDVLTPMAVAAPTNRRPVWSRLSRPATIDYYPEVAAAPELEAAVEAWSPDVLMVMLSEWLTAALSNVRFQKFTYYGNPDPKNRRAYLQLRRRGHEVGAVHAYYTERRNDQFERVHLEHMKRYTWLGDVAANDAAFYTSRGHPCAFYVRHVWIDSPKTERPARTKDVAKIVASVGRLAGTANTYGLEYLGTEMLPAMRRAFGAKRFELHVFGAGEAWPRLRPLLRQDGIVLRGFVDDIDAEISDASAFLCVNNATDYKVGHTRYLHAWSLAAPVVAHRDVVLSMPEFKHGANSLLGGNADEMAAHLRSLCEDESLRRCVGDGGRQTFESDFTAATVAPAIIARLRLGTAQPV